MVILIPLIRRLSLRARLLIGAACLLAGVIAVAAAKALAIPGIVSVVVGGIFLFCGLSGRPRRRTTSARRGERAARVVAGR